MLKKILFLGLALVASVSWSSAQIMPSPARAEGEGPYEKLIIRGVTLIDGTGAPPLGPVDIVVEKTESLKSKPLVIPEFRSTKIVVLKLMIKQRSWI